MINSMCMPSLAGYLTKDSNRCGSIQQLHYWILWLTLQLRVGMFHPCWAGTLICSYIHKLHCKNILQTLKTNRIDGIAWSSRDAFHEYISCFVKVKPQIHLSS